MTPSTVALPLAAGAGAVGVVAGLGGATFLVPLLVVLGSRPSDAAPLGMVAAASSALAATPSQVNEGLVHHRLGVLLELAGTSGAVSGALVAGTLDPHVLRSLLAVVALLGAVAMRPRGGLRNPPHPTFSLEPPGEWPGSLGGTYHLEAGRVVPYQAKHVAPAAMCFAAIGFLAGLSGVGGGFLRTPVLTLICGIPVRVASATSTFTVGVTANTTILVYAAQGRLSATAAAPIVAGALIGGWVGGRLQSVLHPRHVRYAVTLLLFGVAALLVARA